MRFRYGLIAGSLVLAWAAGSAWSQAPTKVAPAEIKTVAPPAPAAVSDLRVRPTDGIRVSTGIPTVQTLDKNECETLGGTVKDDPFGVCKSGKLCARVDNFGKLHNVCLSAK